MTESSSLAQAGAAQRGRNPLLDFIEEQGVAILDAGLATALEDRGHPLEDRLWSARMLIDDPDTIRDVHGDFLAAGADCITTASYQASVAGFRERGMDDATARDLLRRSVWLALEARDDFWGVKANRRNRLKPIVAASVGPYGAVLGDGSEYSGDYDIDAGELEIFHRERWSILADCGADLLACETIPASSEAMALLKVLKQSPQTWAWMSFSCADDGHLWDGTAIRSVAAQCDSQQGVAAVGVNCTAPAHVGGLIAGIRSVTCKPIIAYPNSGEGYDATCKRWQSSDQQIEIATAAPGWVSQGASCVGGCCRIRAADIKRLRQQLVT
jgi:homocysteine S-methyltransferase